MSPLTKAITPAANPTVAKHLVCGSGGSRAILGCGGAILAFQIAGLWQWQTIGGISGGSIPSLLFANGMKAPDLLKLAVSVDFSSLLSRHENPLSILMAFFLKDRFIKTRPRKGVMSSEGLGDFIEANCAAWPANYWTMAIAGNTQIIFTANGVTQVLSDGTARQLSNQPAPLGLAIRASCAVPGIIDAVEYQGRYLFDGALSWDGQCPVGVALRQFGAQPREVVACDVGDQETRGSKWSAWFWELFCGENCVGKATHHEIAQRGVFMIKPQVNSFPSLQFTLTLDQKWQAVMAGFVAAVNDLSKAGLLVGDALKEAQFIAQDLNHLKAIAA